MAEGSVIRFHDLHRSFGPLAVLAGVSGSAGSGQVLAVTGPNGAGKSTLLRLLAGLLAPERGSIELALDGDLLDLDQRRRRVGYVAPDVAFYDELTVEENLRFFARLRRVDPAPGRELAARFELPPERQFGALSSGMRQRLRWALALLGRPLVLLLDEPFQNLDAAGESVARGLLADHLARGPAVVASPTALELPDVATHLRLDR